MKPPDRAKAREPVVKKRVKPAGGRVVKRPHGVKARVARPTTGPIAAVDGSGPSASVTPLRPAAAVDATEHSVRGTFLAVLLGAIAFSIVLLGVSSVPPWTVNNIRAAAMLDRWRGPLAALGVSTLFAVGLVFALHAWSP